MNTRFPARPCDVAALTVHEFTSDLDLKSPPSLEEACHRFLEDANRALVWLIRVRALRTWCARPDMASWLHGADTGGQSACEAAASFTLNDEWEFDVADFRLAVESLIVGRLRH
jgi:hypothetical protein